MAPGRRLIAAFVGGLLAASLLFALPLVTIRDRVTQLEEEQGDLKVALNRTAGDQLVAAGDAVAAANLTPEDAPAWTRASARVEAAGAMANLTSPLTDREAGAIDVTARALDRVGAATACGLLTPESPPARHQASLGTILGGAGQALANGGGVPAAALTTPVTVLSSSLDAWASERVGIVNATLDLDDERVEVNLTGPVPAERCRGSMVVEVCRLSERTEGCFSIEATGPRFEVLDAHVFVVDAMSATNATDAFRVTVTDTHAGQTGSSSCEMPATDGATCSATTEA